MNESLFEIKGICNQDESNNNEVNNNEVLIVSFGGSALVIGGITPFEFVNILHKWFPEYDKKFYIDLHQKWYHNGIKGISTDIDETVSYLHGIISNYKKVIFIGNSAGGYAAILFGSLLNISTVIAFVPQTILYHSDIEERFRNLKYVINDITQYHLYGDTSIEDIRDSHHIYHVDNIDSLSKSNIHIVKKNKIFLKIMRDNGELFQILKSII